MSFRITWKTHAACFAISYITALLANDYIIEIFDSMLSCRFILYPTSSVIINYNIYFIVALVPISIVHELIHGALYRLFGGRVKYGFKGIYAYTQEISGKAISKVKFTIVLLSPAVVITCVCMIIPGWISGMVCILNLLGSSGDVYMTLSLLKYRNGSRIIDRSYGYDVE